MRCPRQSPHTACASAPPHVAGWPAVSFRQGRALPSKGVKHEASTAPSQRRCGRPGVHVGGNSGIKVDDNVASLIGWGVCVVHWPALPRANLKLRANLHVRPKQPVCGLRCSTSALCCRARSVVSTTPRCMYVESREHVDLRTWACGSLLCARAQGHAHGLWGALQTCPFAGASEHHEHGQVIDSCHICITVVL